MTQSDLAGSEMTKSMLSQIENNISNPSIKTLQYIANRLDKPVSYFLDEHNYSNIETAKSIDNKPDETITKISEFINLGETEKAQEEIEKLISNSFFDTSIKPYADILFKLGTVLITLGNFMDAKRYLKISIETYVKGGFYIEGAKAYAELAKSFYQEFNYEECLNISKKAFELYYKDINTDPLFEIELYYYQILILLAVGETNNAAKSIETAITLSSKTSVYYKTDELYRLNAIFSYLRGNVIEYEKNMKKALQFAEFTEDKECLARIYIMMGLAALESAGADKALECAELSKHYLEKELYVNFLIKGRAYYILGNYELAYDNIIKVTFPSYEKHRYDYLNMWSAKVYEGLILNKLKRQDEAIEAIKLGIEKMSFFGSSKFIVNAYKSLSEVYSNMNNFENAFIYLKKANEIQDIISKDDNIIF